MCTSSSLPAADTRLDYKLGSSLVRQGQLRVEPLSVHWRSLTVSIGSKKALQGCSGDVAAGSVLAVMGPSGGGKTTLINALSRRGPLSEGEVRYGGVDGESWSPALKRRVALVEQDDQVLAALTVSETLRFTAALRLSHLSPTERETRINALVSILRLGPCESTRVGDSSAAKTRGISGGERKRLCIACELLTLPSLLFCDEPSSGLDSSMAFVVIDVLKELARIHGVTVISSIHQPSSQVFALFDDLLLLKGGAALYHGPRASAVDHFTAALGRERPSDFSASDWLMEVLVLDYLPAAKETELRHETKAQFAPFKQSSLRRTAVVVEPPRSSWSYQVGVLSRRGWRLAKGHLWVHEVAFLQLVIGLLSGLLFYRIGYDLDDVRSRFSASFLAGLNWMFFPLLAALPLVPKAERMLRKDLQNGAYNLSAWYFPTTTIALIPDLLMLLINTPLLYWLAGIADDAAAFVLTVLSQVLTIMLFQSLGILIAVGSSFTNAESGTIAMLFMAFNFLFTGIFIPVNKMVVPWARFINPLYYSQCLIAQIVFLPGTVYSSEGSSSNALTICGGAVVTRDEALAALGLVTPPGICALVLIGMLAVARLGALLLLQRKMRRELLVQQEAAPRAAHKRTANGERATTADSDIIIGSENAPSSHDAV